MTKEEAEAFTRPHPHTKEAVNSWLEHHAIEKSKIAHVSGAGDWLTVRVSVAQAERMLGTKYNVYHHPVSGQRVVRTMGYSLPRELHSHIDVVAPTTYFGTIHSMWATSFLQPDIKPVSNAVNVAVPSSCSSTITPTCLRDLYNTSTYVPAATNVNKLGVAGYLGEFASTSDLQVGFWLIKGCLLFSLSWDRPSSLNSDLTLKARASLLCKLTVEETIKTRLVSR